MRADPDCARGGPSCHCPADTYCLGSVSAFGIGKVEKITSGAVRGRAGRSAGCSAGRSAWRRSSGGPLEHQRVTLVVEQLVEGGRRVGEPARAASPPEIVRTVLMSVSAGPRAPCPMFASARSRISSSFLMIGIGVSGSDTGSSPKAEREAVRALPSGGGRSCPGSAGPLVHAVDLELRAGLERRMGEVLAGLRIDRERIGEVARPGPIVHVDAPVERRRRIDERARKRGERVGVLVLIDRHPRPKGAVELGERGRRVKPGEAGRQREGEGAVPPAASSACA